MTIQSVRKQFTCDTCGTKGSLRWMEQHPCNVVQDVAAFGGRCEDYPCCGHVGADAGCAPQESHTSEYWTERMRLADDEGYNLYGDPADEMED